MSHSLCKIWVHAVWGTKYRQDLIHPSVESKIHQLIFNQLEDSNCRTRIINGTQNHVHALFLLDKNTSMAKVMKQTKGAVSYEINQQNIIEQKFNWQVGYGAFSVSEDRVSKIQTYIKKQKLHHQKESFQEELDRFWSIYGMEWIEEE